MNIRVTVSVLAVSLVAGAAYNAAARRAGPTSCCAASAAPVMLASAKAVPAPKKPAKPVPKVRRKIVATYFHGNYRCVSCRKIEAWTGDSINRFFAKDIKGGRLEWRVVNVEVKGNEHYMKDYKLFTKSVVLSDVRNGKEVRWKNLDKVWNLLGDEAGFRGYICGEVAAYLKAA